MPDIHPIHPSQAAARNRSAAPWPLLWLVAILLFLLTGCQGETPAVVGTPAPAVTLSDCQIGAEGVSLRLSARCGTLTVPENPDDPAGRQIDLRLAVIPAVSRSPEPDPLFILAGGPGQAATETYVQISGAFQRIHQNRDIVLVDQRGTGGSNPLTCPASETGVDYSADSEDTQRYLQECLQSLDADPAFYTTPLFAADLERVRQALGYGKINLYGVSYGTRSALTYLKMFPDSVRAVILDGVVPMQEPLGIDVARDAQNAIDLILERCSTDAACSQAFPDIQQEFDELVAALREQPVEVSIVHPRSGEPVELSFSIEQLAVAVRLASYAPETAALLPLLIHKAGAEGDYGLLAALYLIVTEQLSDTIALGLNNTVLCSEDMPSCRWRRPAGPAKAPTTATCRSRRSKRPAASGRAAAFRRTIKNRCSPLSPCCCSLGRWIRSRRRKMLSWRRRPCPTACTWSHLAWATMSLCAAACRVLPAISSPAGQ